MGTQQLVDPIVLSLNPAGGKLVRSNFLNCWGYISEAKEKETTQETSNDIIGENGRVLKFYLFNVCIVFVWSQYDGGNICSLMIFSFFLLIHYSATLKGGCLPNYI